MDEDDPRARFFVEADYTDTVTEGMYVRYFAGHQEAVDHYYSKLSQFRCVLLAEWGRYRAGNEDLCGWIYYKWVQDGAWSEAPRGRFEGYAYGSEPLVSYTSANRDGTRAPENL